MAEAIHPSHSIEPAADAVGSDAESGYDERSLSTASVTSSIYDYKTENGRTYHAYKQDKNYQLPNDEQEQERMDLHYHAFRLTYDDKLNFAPVENPTSVVDIGTGTGIWAIECAEKYPGAEVVGIDLSPIQPGYVPTNCKFEVMDAEDEWDMPNRFDYIHTRDMHGYLKVWPNFLKSAFESLQPGGWIENQEFDLSYASDDNSLPADAASLRWSRQWEEGVNKIGMTKRFVPEQKVKEYEAAGFVNINVLPFKMPIGPWAKNKNLNQAGLLTLVGLLDGITGISLRVYTQLLGWSVEQMEELLDEVRKEWKNKKIHSYIPLYVVYAQKPPAQKFR